MMDTTLIQAACETLRMPLPKRELSLDDLEEIFGHSQQLEHLELPHKHMWHSSHMREVATNYLWHKYRNWYLESQVLAYNWDWILFRLPFGDAQAFCSM
jgi:hypothetical protein